MSFWWNGGEWNDDSRTAGTVGTTDPKPLRLPQCGPRQAETSGGDHYRTRLTHTLEVAQIARTISRALRFNEDLTEAIALGHDLGHSPFGHSGEAILNRICPHGYRHYEQSLRVVERLEKGGAGLNLTEEVRDGILCHTNRIAATKEGNVVRVADRIAYMNHDIEDAIRAEILRKEDLPTDVTEVLGNTKTKRITTLVGAVVAHGPEKIGMAPEIQAMHDKLHTFLFDRVYYNPIAKQEEHKAELLIETLPVLYFPSGCAAGGIPENCTARGH